MNGDWSSLVQISISVVWAVIICFLPIVNDKLRLAFAYLLLLDKLTRFLKHEIYSACEIGASSFQKFQTKQSKALRKNLNRGVRTREKIPLTRIGGYSPITDQNSTRLTSVRREVCTDIFFCFFPFSMWCHPNIPGLNFCPSILPCEDILTSAIWVSYFLFHKL